MKLENKLQKTLTEANSGKNLHSFAKWEIYRMTGIAGIGLMALTSLSGCGYHIYCPAYTDINKEIKYAKADTTYPNELFYNTESCKLNN